MRLMLVFVAVCLLSPILAHAQSELKFFGEAYSVDGEALLYTATHSIQLNQKGEYQQSEVIYADSDGQVIASKTLDYRLDPLMPDLDFTDHRDNQKIQVTKRQSELTLKTNAEGDTEKHAIELRTDGLSIVDAGFDRLVKTHWNELLDGDVIEFEFLALSRARMVTFTVEMTGKTHTHVDMQIAPSNWLVSLLMEPIRLRYDAAEGLLREYRGITNLRAWEAEQLSEDNYEAYIRYRYAHEMNSEPLSHANNIWSLSTRRVAM